MGVGIGVGGRGVGGLGVGVGGRDAAQQGRVLVRVVVRIYLYPLRPVAGVRRNPGRVGTGTSTPVYLLVPTYRTGPTLAPVHRRRSRYLPYLPNLPTRPDLSSRAGVLQ